MTNVHLSSVQIAQCPPMRWPRTGRNCLLLLNYILVHRPIPWPMSTCPMSTRLRIQWLRTSSPLSSHLRSWHREPCLRMRRRRILFSFKLHTMTNGHAWSSGCDGRGRVLLKPSHLQYCHHLIIIVSGCDGRGRGGILFSRLLRLPMLLLLLLHL